MLSRMGFYEYTYKNVIYKIEHIFSFKEGPEVSQVQWS